MYHFIYNPTAGKGKAQRARTAIEGKLRMLNVPYAFHETHARGDARRIAQELTHQGVREITAIGGDGTVHEVLNGIEDPGCVNLGVIPCGSGNDFAAAAGIPADPETAVELILKGEPLRTDYMECAGVRGLNVIGAGIDVEILRRCYRAKVLKGSVNYFVSLLISLVKFVQYRFSSERDERRGTHEGLIVCACNGRQFGGGIAICPDAVYDDGQMDVVIVQDVKKAMIPGALVKLVSGKILRQPYTLHERARRLRAAFDRPAPIQIDGEIYEDLPFDVKIVSGELKMYRP